MMHIVCYLRQGSKVFETYWTTRRGVEAMGNSYALLDMTVYGRQETWEARRPAGHDGRKASTLTVPRDVPSPSGLACRPGMRTTWEPAGAEPRLPLLRPAAKGRDEVGFDVSMAWLRRHNQC